MMKMVNGVSVPMTENEIANRQAEELAWESGAGERERQKLVTDLKQSDAGMARVIEDIYDVLTEEQKAVLPQSVKDKIEQRRALRAQLR